MAKITAKQLVSCFQRYCAEKWGYVWGLNGSLYTQALADQYKAQRRRTSKWRNPTTYWTEDCKQWIGRMAADCSGGIVSAFREFIPDYGDRTANGFYGQCSDKGPIKTIPEIPGLCVWRDGHIGIYEGNGNVIEFRGTEYGCVRTKLSGRNFTNWGKLRDVEYSTATAASAPAKQEAGKLNLHQLIFTKNACYIAGAKMTPKGIMVHSTGANNPNLKRYVGPDDGLLGKNQYGNHWNRAMDRQVCVHAFIGKLADGSIATYQTLPWDMVGWHSGSGSKGNANRLGYIGFEICEDGLTDASYFNAVYQEAVQLCAMLCKTYGINPEKPSLICHSEGRALGIASNHGDVMHWFPKHGKSMDTFRADVQKAMGGAAVAPATPTASTASTDVPFLVKVTANTLNIRKGPGTNYAVVGAIKNKGVYTMMEVRTGAGSTKGWGRLKSGAGWISLDYCTRR